MKETGLMFKAPLVRAILDGQKTQTRRLVKWKGLDKGLNLGFSGLRAVNDGNEWVLESNSRTSSEWRCQPTLCPMGQPGDRIYVRETFAMEDNGHEEWPVFRADNAAPPTLPPSRGPARWKPAIHMPKDLARIWLEITGVRVERLQQITDAECWAEGAVTEARPDQFSVHSVIATDGKAYLSPRGAFSALWESTGGDWAANPWVWVIDFKRIEKPQAST